MNLVDFTDELHSQALDVFFWNFTWVEPWSIIRSEVFLKMAICTGLCLQRASVYNKKISLHQNIKIIDSKGYDFKTNVIAQLSDRRTEGSLYKAWLYLSQD